MPCSSSHALSAAIGDKRVFDVAGLSIGGLVALGLAQAFPASVRRLVVANSAIYLPADTHATWRARAERACRTRMDGIVSGTLARCFTDDFRSRQTAVCESVARQLRGCDPAAYAALTEILLATDLRHAWPRSHTPCWSPWRPAMMWCRPARVRTWWPICRTHDAGHCQGRISRPSSTLHFSHASSSPSWTPRWTL